MYCVIGRSLNAIRLKSVGIASPWDQAACVTVEDNGDVTVSSSAC